ncbi:protein translocase subunit SecF [bacterium]|nr:protein translocase subunit SecF [bacterium]NIN92436.1 protein translocase subunit SecF [bacterium]NIO18550.1 protein translocase subunit SecF [bacterium]NIO73546.1 protein translocase subunit SecF [bacterium]
MQFFGKTNFKFIEKRKKAFILSGLMILLSAYAIFHKGVNFGIDFTGGTLVQINFSREITVGEMRETLSRHELSGATIQKFPNSNVMIIRVKSLDVGPVEIARKLSSIFQEEFSQDQFTIDRNEVVGPVVGEYLKKRGTKAFLLAFLGIIIYIAWRFIGGIWGLAGVTALIHDVFITFGIFTILGKEITLPIVAALLTLAGYSINDTIVVYDRIRENIRLQYKKPLAEVINSSINETLSRTMMTSLTTLLVVLSIFILGGPVIHDFSFAILIGIFIGTYSSIFIASPLVYEWRVRKSR